MNDGPMRDATGGKVMRSPLAILPLLAIGLTIPAFGQDAASAAKQACENVNTLGATGDAAKLVSSFYTEKAVFIGPAPVAGILIGRDAIEKNFAGFFQNYKSLSADCQNAVALNESTALVSGTWMGTPKDASKSPVKGGFGITFVKEEGKWLAAMDSWNMDLPPTPAKTD
jgi:ketosteroid isomerase-like protein